MSGATLNNWDESAERHCVSRYPINSADTRSDSLSIRCPLCWPEFLTPRLTMLLERLSKCRRAPCGRNVQIAVPCVSCEPLQGQGLRSIFAGTMGQAHPRCRTPALRGGVLGKNRRAFSSERQRFSAERGAWPRKLKPLIADLDSGAPYAERIVLESQARQGLECLGGSEEARTGWRIL